MARLPNAVMPKCKEDGLTCIVLHSLNECSRHRQAFKHKGYGLPQHQLDIAYELCELLHIDVTFDRLADLAEWMRFRAATAPDWLRAANWQVRPRVCNRCGMRGTMCQLPPWFDKDDDPSMGWERGPKNERILEPAGRCVIMFATGLLHKPFGIYPPLWQFEHPTDWPLLDKEMAVEGIGPWKGKAIRPRDYQQRTNDERFPSRDIIQELWLKADPTDKSELFEFESPDRI